MLHVTMNLVDIDASATEDTKAMELSIANVSIFDKYTTLLYILFYNIYTYILYYHFTK